MERPENKRGVPSVFTCVDGTEVKTKRGVVFKAASRASGTV